MKKLLLTLCFTMIVSLFTFFHKSELNAEESKVKIPVSLSYSSLYWWRGTEFFGDNGVIWPGIALEYNGLSIFYAAGYSEALFTAENTADEKIEKARTEMDYGISYSMETDMLNIGLGAAFFQYPYYDEADKTLTDPSFYEGSLSIGLKTLLNPTIEFFYDYYVKEHKGSGDSNYSKMVEPTEDVPVNKDYYVRFGLSHDIISTSDGFTFSAAGTVGYYNDPYFEMSGWSDAVATLGISKEHNNLSFSSSFNYGRTLSEDFRYYNGGKKNHFWCDFGITYTPGI